MVEPIINPESLIVTVSLGTGMTISFRNDDGQQPIEMVLEDGSVLEMARHSQDFWTHHMNQSNNGTVNYLFTFLHASPHFLQLTILLGDSNTARINFGSGKGTLGVWMPGKRVAAMFIEDIPDACNIGPYHNIILHTGINNIKNPYNRKSNAALISSLRSKCDDIAHTYPKARVFISLLLPSKSTSLNFQVRQFNNNLIDFAFVRKNVFIIDHPTFGDVLSDSYGRWDTSGNRACPNVRDTLHLGKKGLNKFAFHMKTAVMGRRKRRTNAPGYDGNYRNAVTNNMHCQNNSNISPPRRGANTRFVTRGSPRVYHQGYQSQA